MLYLFLLTAPFDEDAKTGDGQYAASLEAAFAKHYAKVPAVWLKKAKGHYAIPFPAGTTSVPANTIPSAIVLQPVANESTVISGYKLDSNDSSDVEALNVNKLTVSPKTPKIILEHDNSLRTLTIMDIYSKKPIQLDVASVRSIITTLNVKNAQLIEVTKAHAAEMRKSYNSKLHFLTKSYRENKDEIQSYCTLNEYIEAHMDGKKFTARIDKALNVFTELERHFTGPANLKDLEKLTEKLTGIKDYPYDFHSKTLPYDLENDTSFKNLYDLDGLKTSIGNIIVKLNALKIRQSVAKRHPHSLHALSSPVAIEDKLAFINLLYSDDYAAQHDKQTFINALLDPSPLDLDLVYDADLEDAIKIYNEIDTLLINKKDIIENPEYRAQLLHELQTLASINIEPYLSLSTSLPGFYAKRKLSASEGFHLAYQANQRDPIKHKVIDNLIISMQPIGSNTHLDIHIRPPDCGVFITADDIKRLQDARIKVNVTIHEYKQNYTRRYLQQYTHDLMRQADTVQFFNASDRDNAIIAASYGDCDKRNTTEPSGIAKKDREVGLDFNLNTYPVIKYDLAAKSGLTVASQKLSTFPAHPNVVVAKPPNILSFGTIRPGKGFEEALKLAQLVKENALDINRVINKIPVVKLAGDPQDPTLMLQIVVERFGEEAVAAYQQQPTQGYEDNFTSAQRRDYWKKLVSVLNKKESDGELVLNNPYLEIYPWCEPHELLALKESSKYVCRMDDMGMRNNGSAIISVLDVGIVYTKFGSVTDDIYLRGGQYGKAVDIGEYRFGRHNLELKAAEYKRKSITEPLLFRHPDSTYKRQPQSRAPRDILDSIIAREVNQLQMAAEIEKSENYQTILEAQKLLKEHFTLKKAADHLLTNLGQGHLITAVEKDELVAKVDAVQSLTYDLSVLSGIPLTQAQRASSWPDAGFFGARRDNEVGLKTDQQSDIIDRVGQSLTVM